MNKLLLFLLLLPFGVSAQVIQKNTTYGMAFNRTGADTLFYLPVDTFAVPTAYRTYNFMARKGTTLYIWNTSTFAWQAVTGGGGTAGWELTGNSGTVAGTNFIGTTDAVAVVVKANNTERMRVLSGGNVGIGTSAPDSMLTVNGGLYTNRGVRFTGLPATDTTVSLIGIKADGTAVITTKSSLTPTLQQVLTAGSSLTGNNTIEANGYNFWMNSINSYIWLNDDQVSLRAKKPNSDNSAIFYVDHTSADPYIAFEANQDTTQAQVAMQATARQGGSDFTLYASNGDRSARSDFILRSDSALFKPFRGQANIDSLRTATDTTLSKPMTFDPATGRWQYLPYWPSGGGGSGVTTVGTFSGSAQTNGASISGSTITFGPASATVPGMVSTGAQNIAGVKTFADKIVVEKTPSGSIANMLQMEYTDLATGSGASIQFSTFGGTLVGGFNHYRTGSGAYEFSLNNWDGASNAEIMRVKSYGTAGSNKLGIGNIAPTAVLHIAAGGAGANGAPLKFTSGVSGQTTKEAGAVNYDGSNLTLSDATYAYTLSKTLTGSGTLNFGSIAHHSEEVLTITVTGAADGDAVSLGIPNASNTTNVIFTAWVSAANTVSVKCSNLDASASVDPASGTFKISVIK